MPRSHEGLPGNVTVPLATLQSWNHRLLLCQEVLETAVSNTTLHQDYVTDSQVWRSHEQGLAGAMLVEETLKSLKDEVEEVSDAA